jgi:predicted short-subunit dehydrogenase-like oxidoreductase (DUF2520 family)
MLTMNITINIIGAGRVGKTLGYLFHKNQLGIIGIIYNRSIKNAIDSVNFIGAGRAVTAINRLPAADITFITTSDDAIINVCKVLVDNDCLKPNSIVVHCSGSLTSEILMGTKKQGCLIASIHPMRSFAEPSISIKQFNPTYCALEGDLQAITALKPLFQALGAITYLIDKSKKIIYHAAGIFASNYLLTLAEQALVGFKTAGISEDLAMSIVLNLMQGTLTNLVTTKNTSASLTGPIKRADIKTINQHMASLSVVNQATLYGLLGQATLLLTDHDAITKNGIKQALLT